MTPFQQAIIRLTMQYHVIFRTETKDDGTMSILVADKTFEGPGDDKMISDIESYLKEKLEKQNGLSGSGE